MTHCDVICSDWPWTCHQLSHCISSTTTAWYQGLPTIQRDDIDKATSTLTITLGMPIFNVGNIGNGNVYSFLMRAGSSYSELMAGLGYTDVQEREQLRAVFRRLYRLVVDLWWFGMVWPTADRPIFIGGTLTAHSYINHVLRPVLLPFLRHQPRLLFQQDNARPHTARVVQHFFAKTTSMLPWPAVHLTWHW